MNGYELLIDTVLIKDLKNISRDLFKSLYYIKDPKEQGELESIFSNRLSLNCIWTYTSNIGAKPEIIVFEIDYTHKNHTPKIFNIDYYPEYKWYLDLPTNLVDRSFYNNHTKLSFSESDNEMIEKVKNFIESIKCKDFELYTSYKIVFDENMADLIYGVYEWVFTYRESFGNYKRFKVGTHEKEDLLEFIDIKLTDKYPINIFSDSFFKLTDEEITLLECYCI